MSVHKRTFGNLVKGKAINKIWKKHTAHMRKPPEKQTILHIQLSAIF